MTLLTGRCHATASNETYPRGWTATSVPRSESVQPCLPWLGCDVHPIALQQGQQGWTPAGPMLGGYVDRLAKRDELLIH